MSSNDIKPWCKLTSITKKVSDIFISSDIHTIGRKDRNNSQIKNAKISGTHCIITREKESDGSCVYYLEDLSTNGTFLNDSKIGCNDKSILADGDEIMLLNRRQVKKSGKYRNNNRYYRISLLFN